MSTGFIISLRRGAVLALAALLFVTTHAEAAGATVFGPRTFTRTTGTPKEERVRDPKLFGNVYKPFCPFVRRFRQKWRDVRMSNNQP